MCMEQANKEEYVLKINRLAEVYNFAEIKVNLSLFLQYWKSLKRYELDIFSDVIEYWIDNKSYFPKISSLVKLCNEATKTVVSVESGNNLINSIEKRTELEFKLIDQIQTEKKIDYRDAFCLVRYDMQKEFAEKADLLNISENEVINKYYLSG